MPVITKKIICPDCKFPFDPGDLVIEEWVNGLLLPPAHRYCLEPKDYLNAIRRGKCILWTFPNRPDGAPDEDIFIEKESPNA